MQAFNWKHIIQQDYLKHCQPTIFSITQNKLQSHATSTLICDLVEAKHLHDKLCSPAIKSLRESKLMGCQMSCLLKCKTISVLTCLVYHVYGHGMKAQHHLCIMNVCVCHSRLGTEEASEMISIKRRKRCHTYPTFLRLRGVRACKPSSQPSNNTHDALLYAWVLNM